MESLMKAGDLFSFDGDTTWNGSGFKTWNGANGTRYGVQAPNYMDTFYYNNNVSNFFPVGEN